MKTINLFLSASLFLISGNSMADSWTITQSVTVDTSTEVFQKETSSGSVQAFNSINLDGTNGVVKTGSTQNLNIQDNNLKLEQSDGTAASSQAVNRVYANTINDIQQSVTTSGTISNTITLEQGTTIGDENYQSINSAVTSDAGQVDALTQNVSTSGHIIVYRQKAGTSNIQAGNLIKSGNLSTTSGAVSQSHSAGYASFYQSDTSNSIQAGNALIMISGQGGGTLAQEFTSTVHSAPFISYAQSSTNGSVQSMNYAGDEL